MVILVEDLIDVTVLNMNKIKLFILHSNNDNEKYKKIGSF